MNCSWKFRVVLIILILAVTFLVLKGLWPLIHGM